MTDLGPCRSCSALMRWVKTQKRRRMPLDPEPDEERGNVIVDVAGIALVFADATGACRYKAEHGGEGPFTSHFATCPNARRHRRRSRESAEGA